MREVLLMAIVAGICLSTVHTPIYGLFGYVWFALCRPDVLSFSHKPFSLILAVTVLLGAIRHLANVPRLFGNPISLLLLLQQIPIAISVVLAVRTDLAMVPYRRYLIVILMSLLIVLMVETEQWLRVLYFVMVLSMGLIAAKFTGSGILAGGAVRFSTGFAGFYGDSNGLSLAMTILLPLAVYGRALASNYLLKLACLGVAGAAIVVVVLCGSRGNALACGLVGLLMVWRSKYKLIGIVTMVLLAIPALYLGGQRFSERIQSVSEYDQDNSATSRLQYWAAALKITKDYPVFGVGYGEQNYVFVAQQRNPSEDLHVVHNTYLQMMVDIGIPGFLLYIATLFGAIFWLEFSRRRMKKLKPEWIGYPAGLQMALIGFAAGSTFYSRGDFEFAYFVLMAAAAWHGIEKQFLKSLEAPRPVFDQQSRIAPSKIRMAVPKAV
jgi:putative inorganic carbon (hco3(-)) transporter